MRGLARLALGAPGEARLACGVDGGEDQAAGHRHVLEEVDLLVRACPAGRTPPRTGVRRTSSAPASRPVRTTTAAGLARRQHRAGDHMDERRWRSPSACEVRWNGSGLALSIAGSSLSVTGSARSAIASMFFRELIPPMMNDEASIGRASLLTRTMPHSYPLGAYSSSDLGCQPVQVAGEQGDLADVVGLDQASGPALQARSRSRRAEGCRT